MVEDDLRQRAIHRLRAKHDFRKHLNVYLAVNALLVAIWAITGMGYFWPIWPIVGWGLGLVFHWWGVFGDKGITEDEIHAEMERLRGSGGTGP